MAPVVVWALDTPTAALVICELETLTEMSVNGALASRGTWEIGGAATGFFDLRGKKVDMSIVLGSLSSGTCLMPLRLLSLHILELSSSPKDDRSPNPERLLPAAIKLFILGRLVDRSCLVAF